MLGVALGCVPVPGELFDVVDQAIHLPLPVDFSLTTQREAIEPFVVADVCKYRLRIVALSGVTELVRR